MKSTATVVFVRKVCQGSNYRKDFQLKSFYWHVMLRLFRFANFSLLFVKLPLFSLIKLNSSFCICNNNKKKKKKKKKKNFQFFLFEGICKSRLYSLDLSTDIPILDSLLVHVYYMIAYQEGSEVV